MKGCRSSLIGIEISTDYELLKHCVETNLFYQVPLKMLFNSFVFFVFVACFWVLFWFVFNKKLWQQNLLVLLASYVFYGWWDYRFLSLLAVSSAVDYLLGKRIQATARPSMRKLLLCCSLLVNLGMLGLFKYYNFFVSELILAFQSFDFELSPRTLNIILPVGISFYTFQTLSYTIDVFRGKLAPTTDPIRFFAFVSFFPQLVAGPIERASNLLSQFDHIKKFNLERTKRGIRQIVWGFFKKIVIADNCGSLVDEIFTNHQSLPPHALWLGAVYFAFQIYGDFSGYSDIAIGLSRVFGFDLMVNFRYPYFSRDIAEFWRRWHISLSTWFRDYLYIPLGGSQGGVSSKIRNTIIVFLVSGFWHGANWTFLVWGALNAAFIIPLMFSGRNRHNLNEVAADSRFPSIREVWHMSLTFVLTCVAWVFFRSASIGLAFTYVKGMVALDLDAEWYGHFGMLIPIVFLLLVEWVNRKSEFPEFASVKNPVIRLVIYGALIYITIVMSKTAQDFIYFQF